MDGKREWKGEALVNGDAIEAFQNLNDLSKSDVLYLSGVTGCTSGRLTRNAWRYKGTEKWF